MVIQKILQPICRTHKGGHIALVKNVPEVANAYCQLNTHTKVVAQANQVKNNISRKYCLQTSKATKEKIIKKRDEENNCVDPSKTEELKKRLSQSVKLMFLKSYDYSLLHKDIVLESNFLGTNQISSGILSYAIQLMKFRFHLHYHYPEVLVSTEDATLIQSNGLIIRIPWKLSTVPQRHVLKFWRLFKSQDVLLDSEIIVINGISDFHIGGDGLVHKHCLNKVQ